MRLVIAEKPSVAAALAAALGVKNKRTDIWRAAATSFHGAWGIWWSLWKPPPMGSSTKVEL